MMATDTKTAPDLDALAGLLQQAHGVLPTTWHARADKHGMWRVESAGELVCEGCSRAEAVVIAAAINALPALLATARRERRYREALDRLEWDDGRYGTPCPACQRDQQDGHADGCWLDAALAEEGQDRHGR